MAVFLSILLLLFATSCTRTDKAEVPEVRENVLAEAAEDGYSLKLVADQEAFSVDKPIGLTAIAAFPEGSRLVQLDLSQKGLPAFEILQGEHTNLLNKNKLKQTTETRRFILDPRLEQETYEIPAVTATFTDADGGRHSVATEPVELAVAQVDDAYWASLSVTPDTTLQRTLTPAADRRRRRLLLAGAAVLLLAAAAIASWLSRRRRKTPVVPEIPPYEQASAALDGLLQEKLLLKGETKRYYTGLSDILRRYIERRFSLAAPRQTTQEFIGGLVQGACEALAQHTHFLKTFLLTCDMVKFAKESPQTDEGEMAAKACRDFLEATKPAPETTAPQNK